MIDIKNQYHITDDDRRIILERALWSHPYFYKTAFDIPANSAGLVFRAQALGIDRDFYLTEIQGNFGEAFESTSSLFNVSLSTAYKKSLYRFEAGRKLPTGFIAQEARFRATVATQIFDDTQQESFPFHIRKNDKVYTEIENLTGNSAFEVITVLKGFSLLDALPTTPIEVKQLNVSLDSDVQWSYFTFNVDREGRNTYTFQNDKFPRLVLGFGAINSTADKGNVPEVIVNSIVDVSRRLNLTDEAMPLEFIAPRLTCLADAHLYYLPIEYYFQPLSKLQFDITNTSVDPNDLQGVEIAMLTRTI